MLSAVAARKARLAQTQAQSPTSSTLPTALPPSIPLPEQKVKGPSSAQKPSSQKPPSKRKLSSYQEGSTKKKKTQNRKSSPARYFAQPTDGFKLQDVVIAVDESDSESSESSQSSSSDDESPLRIQPTAKTAAKRRSRAWSPSAPLSDSSDEDEDENGTAEPLVLDTLNISSSSRPLEAAPAQLSTFKPILQQNVLPLDSADVGDCLGKRALLLLKQSETVALLGAYTLTILRGTISLAGVSLQASPTSHRVFAPRSSPIPVIQCQRAPSKNTQLPPLPANILAAAQGYDAVISIQEMITGVEGLGKICRTFDGAFAPSRWRRSQLQFDLGLDSVYFVRFRVDNILLLL